MLTFSIETLVIWANSKYYYLRQDAASNPNTPPEILARLADDESWVVRNTAAGNPNTPRYVKDYLNAIYFWRTCYES